MFMLGILTSAGLHAIFSRPGAEARTPQCDLSMDRVALDRLRNALFWYQPENGRSLTDIERAFFGGETGWDGPYVLRWRLEDRSGTPIFHDIDLRDPLEFRLVALGAGMGWKEVRSNQEISGKARR